MKQSNFSVKLFTQTGLVFVLLSLLLTFVFTSVASAQDYRYTVAKDDDLPKGLIVALLQGHLFIQTQEMIDDGRD